jgi:hypothetical protein
MTKALGETFGRDMAAAGIPGLPISWGRTDDTIQGRDGLTPEQNATLEQVIAAHDPSAKLPPAPSLEAEVLYVHENRLRALEGYPPVSMLDFIVGTALAKGQRRL